MVLAMFPSFLGHRPGRCYFVGFASQVADTCSTFVTLNT